MEGNTITYRQQKSFCSKPGCRKCRAGAGHGPYWYAYQTVNGRSVRAYIGKTLPPDVQPEQIALVLPGVLSPPTQNHTSLRRLFTLGQVRLESSGADGTWQTVTETGWQQ